MSDMNQNYRNVSMSLKRGQQTSMMPSYISAAEADPESNLHRHSLNKSIVIIEISHSLRNGKVSPIFWTFHPGVIQLCWILPWSNIFPNAYQTIYLRFVQHFKNGERKSPRPDCPQSTNNQRKSITTAAPHEDFFLGLLGPMYGRNDIYPKSHLVT